MRSFLPFNAPKLLGGGTVGVQYSENHKPPPCLDHFITKLRLSRKPSAYWVAKVSFTSDCWRN